MNILGVGARGPLGLSSPQLAMCARARKSEPKTVPHLRDKRHRQIGAHLTGGLPLDLYGQERLLRLAVPALTEACHETISMLAGQPLSIPLLLALPDADRPGEQGEDIIASLTQRCGLPIASEGSQTLRLGRASMATALQMAQDTLAAGAPLVAVGGVDSFYHPDTLRWLDDELRLQAVDVDDALTPGEGAAFLLLCNQTAFPKETPLPPVLARVTWHGTACEQTVLDDEPNAAAALTDLIEQIEAQAPLEWLLSDVNGEHFRVRELSLLTVRHQLGSDRIQVDRLSDELGEIGAATGATLAAIACSYWRLGCGPSPRATILLSSDGADRGAFVMEAGA